MRQTRKKNQRRGSILTGSFLRTLLIGGLCGLSPVMAKAQPGMPSQTAPVEEAAPAQLPPEFADQQIPQTFPDAADEQASAVSNESAPAPAPEEIPAQPEARKLVPATAMGAAAQGANAGASQQADNATPQAPATTPRNSVEDAAATFDQQSGGAASLNNEEPPADIVEEYTARAADLSAASNQDSADDLPQVSNANMPKMEGFENAGDMDIELDETLASGKTSEELKQEIRTEAYDAALTGMFPLTPEQIEMLMRRHDETAVAAKKLPYTPPRPEISVINVSLDPGVMPPALKTAVGNVTTINILDATGAPWPVQDVTWAGDYEVVEPEEGGHIIRITPMSDFARGNIVIRLLTLKTPLTLSLETGRDTVQYRVDARIPEYGPFASAPIMKGGKSLVAGSPDLTSLLDGVMPGGMIKLNVAGADGRTTAYMMGGTTYVRTPLTLLSPAWQSSVSSADGMNVYALSNAPVLLLSDSGDFVRASLSEKEDLLDE